MRPGIVLFLISLVPYTAFGQLVGPTAVPDGVIPVVFVDGYQLGCSGSSNFQSNFGSADTVMQSAGLVTVYFDNCTVSGNPPIETLGAAFGKFLASLTYVNGSPVPLVDVVAHSMGGLIVRAYLAGMQTVVAGASTTFSPPAVTGIRKVVFLGTPHFGTYAANDLGDDAQTHEMSLGSQFLYDLNTWNQGTDDLRGVDALAIVGNGGTGLESTLAGSNISGFDDGLIELTSSSLGFAITGRTRIVPDCHTADPLLVDFDLCAPSTPALNMINDASNVVGQIITSFITGTSAWTTLGQAIEQNANGQTVAGLLVGAEDMNGNPLTVTSAKFGTNSSLGVNAAAYKEAVSANAKGTLTVNISGGTTITPTIVTPAGTTLAVIAKTGPSITGIVPAGIAQFPRDVAPGAYVTVYGSNLAANTVTSPQPYPTQLADAQVLVNGTAADLQYVSATQINFVYPEPTGLAGAVVGGLQQITVKNSSGQQTVNVYVVPAVPSIFTTTGVASGPAAAENAVTGAVINANNALNAGDYVALYLTGNGTGLTTTVTVGGQSCAGQYFFAGPNSVYQALDQVNCQIPSGVTGPAVPVVVTTNGYASNTATLNIQ